MDNADLEKLKLSCGSLCPAFHKNTTRYTVTLPSGEEAVKFTVITSDSGASYEFKVDGKRTGDKTVKVGEGASVDVVVGVCSEDGSGKKDYTLTVKRLSAHDASLTKLTLVDCQLDPVFSPAIFEYDVTAPSACSELTVKAGAADSKMTIDVQDSGKVESVVKLHAGLTPITIKVTSANGSKSACYHVNVQRRHWSFVATPTTWANECPVCLGTFHCPVVTDTSRKQRYCQVCIGEMTRTRQVDFVSQEAVSGAWLKSDAAAEKSVSATEVQCPQCSEKMVLRMAAQHLAQCKAGDIEEQSCGDCSRKIVKGDQEQHKKFICSGKHKEAAFNHSTTPSLWEKQLQSSSMGPDDAANLMAQGKKFEELYRTSLPGNGQPMQFEVGQSPMDYLEKAAVCYAAAIHVAPRNGEDHLRLGLLQEEIYFHTDLYQIKTKESDESADDNAAAKTSSKDEEFLAICQLRGVGADAPLARQLKAVEAEYQALKEQKSQQKAEHVQMLYGWKSAQVAKGGALKAQASDQGSPLGRAHLKFCDALKCDASSHVFNLHVGRMLLQQGETTEALARLQTAVSIRPTAIEARFLLGVAILMCDVTDRLKEASVYMMDGLNALQKSMRTRKYQPPLLGETVLRPDNALVLQGLVLLEQWQCKMKEFPASMATARSTAHMAVTAMHACPNNRSNSYRQFGWTLIDSHAALLNASVLAGSESKLKLAERCSRLIALMKSCNVPASDDALIALQLKTCEQAVRLQPGSSMVLCALGEAQLGQFDLAPDGDKQSAELLKLSELSFRASIDMEEKPVASKDICKFLAEQSWWTAAAAASTPSSPSKGQTGASTAAVDAKKTPTPVGASKPAGRNAPGPAGRGAAAAGRCAAGRGAAARGPGTVTRGAASTAKPPVGRAATKPAITSQPAAPKAGGVRACDTKATPATATTTGTTARGTPAAASRGAKTSGAPCTRPTTSKTPTRPAVGSTAQKPATKTTPAGRTAPASSAAKPSPASTAGKAATPGSMAKGKPGSTAVAGKPATSSGAKPGSNAAADATPVTGAASKPTEMKSEPAVGAKPAVGEEESKEVNRFSHYSRLGLARALSRSKDDALLTESKDLYNTVISKVPSEHDAYIELAEMLVKSDPLAAADIYCRFPFRKDDGGDGGSGDRQDDDTAFDDAFIHGEIVRLLMRQEQYDDARLEVSMVAVGRLMGLGYLEKYANKLEEKFKYKMLMRVYAGVNRKDENDMDMQAFFKVKCWK